MDIPFGLSPAIAAYMGAVLFVAAFVRGYSGFGFAALVVAGASLVTNPLYFVPLVLIVDIPLTLTQIPGIRGRIAWQRVFALSGGALLGAPLGVWAVSQMGIDPARIAISVFVLVMCAALLAGWQITQAMGARQHIGVGILSGVANGASVGGLPVAVFFTAQPIPPAVFRATVIAYFTCLDLITIPLMIRAGMISADTLWAALYAMPVLWLGIWLGGRRFFGTSPESFRRFAILLLASLATLGIARGVIG